MKPATGTGVLLKKLPKPRGPIEKEKSQSDDKRDRGLSKGNFKVLDLGPGWGKKCLDWLQK